MVLDGRRYSPQLHLLASRSKGLDDGGRGGWVERFSPTTPVSGPCHEMGKSAKPESREHWVRPRLVELIIPPGLSSRHPTSNPPPTMHLVSTDAPESCQLQWVDPTFR